MSLDSYLREFCGRNGFDHGYISRLEQGKADPPKSEKLLKKYAAALNLGEGSEEYERFIDLAAGESGGLSRGVAGSRTSATELSNRSPQPRSEGRRRGGLICATHLEDWAGSLDVGATMPLLLRKLIRRTNSSAETLDFPDGEPTHRSGLGGKVVAKTSTELVPDNFSAWEAGVSNDLKKEADENYDRRTSCEEEFDLTNSTFIFVTPRKWTEKQNWIDQKKAEGTWKDVRVYDSTNLEEWLEEAPVVDLWLATRLGISLPGFRSVDENWKNISPVGSVALAG